MGTQITSAPRVTHSEASISGSIPNSGGSEVGYQLSPSRKALRLTLPKMGRASLNKTSTMPIRKTSEEKASAVNRYFISRSFFLFISRLVAQKLCTDSLINAGEGEIKGV